MAFQTPILLITFNRPTHAAKVLAAIKEQRPRYMFVFRDGPRPNITEDTLKCQAVEDLIKREVDWDCELKTCFESENLGCGLGPAEAINWFFKHVDEGIILEDDCIPSQSFFPYCQKLLEVYRYDDKLYMISGFNHIEKWKPDKFPFFSSIMAASLGWASWRRAWSYFDYRILSWDNKAVKDKICKNFGKKSYFNTFKKDFDFVFANIPKDIWDIQWFFARISNKGKTIVPSKNLIRNIGFGIDSTHTNYEGDLRSKIRNLEIDMPNSLPKLTDEPLYDWIVYERFFNKNKRSFYKKFILKTLKLIYKFK